MGISVQASGIKVEKNKYYLVNLNADPSLNELLVYYLKVFNSFYKFIPWNSRMPCLSGSASSLTFWRRNNFFNFSTPCI